MHRLLAAAEVRTRPRGQQQPVHWVCARAGDLAVDDFRFEKGRKDGEVAEHYSVESGVSPGIEVARRFVDIAHFEKRKRTDT